MGLIAGMLISLIVWPSIGWCADPWTPGDKYREYTFLTIDLIDWLQTRDIAAGNKFYEMNPVLGRRPSLDQVNLYFASTALLHVGIVHLLPKKYRPWFQYITIGLSGACVVNNFRVGVNLRF